MGKKNAENKRRKAKIYTDYLNKKHEAAKKRKDEKIAKDTEQKKETKFGNVPDSTV